MRGEVLQFDSTTGGGTLADAYGARYVFDGAAAHGSLQIGDKVEFDAVNGVAANIRVVPDDGTVIPPVTPTTPSPWSQPDPAAAQAYPSVTSSAPYDFTSAMFSFNGRMRRSHYWISWSILFVIGLIISLIPFVNLLGIALLWPNLAKDVKRLHDMGVSGWIVAIPYGLGVAGYVGFFAILLGSGIDPNTLDATNIEAMQTFGSAFLVLMGMMLVQIGFWLWMGIADSQRGANRFGPNPKGL